MSLQGFGGREAIPVSLIFLLLKMNREFSFGSLYVNEIKYEEFTLFCKN